MPVSELESSIQRKILALLSAHGIEAWRTNSGSTNYRVRGAPRGTADIIGIANDGTGRFIGIEVKRPDQDSQLSTAQIEWHAKIGALGGLVGVARSEDETRALLHLWGLI